MGLKGSLAPFPIPADSSSSLSFSVVVRTRSLILKQVIWWTKKGGVIGLIKVKWKRKKKAILQNLRYVIKLERETRKIVTVNPHLLHQINIKINVRYHIYSSQYKDNRRLYNTRTEDSKFFINKLQKLVILSKINKIIIYEGFSNIVQSSFSTPFFNWKQIGSYKILPRIIKTFYRDIRILIKIENKNFEKFEDNLVKVTLYLVLTN